MTHTIAALPTNLSRRPPPAAGWPLPCAWPPWSGAIAHVRPARRPAPACPCCKADRRTANRSGSERLRGQVVLVFYWSTDCAVCRDKMPELRANLAGWQAATFTLLGVNMDDRSSDDLVRYEDAGAPDRARAATACHRSGAGDPALPDNLGPVHPPAQRRS